MKSGSSSRTAVWPFSCNRSKFMTWIRMAHLTTPVTCESYMRWFLRLRIFRNEYALQSLKACWTFTWFTSAAVVVTTQPQGQLGNISSVGGLFQVGSQYLQTGLKSIVQSFPPVCFSASPRFGSAVSVLGLWHQFSRHFIFVTSIEKPRRLKAKTVGAPIGKRQQWHFSCSLKLTMS